MDDDISIKNRLETMDSEEIWAIKAKLEALKSNDIAEDAISVRMSLVKMCRNIIAERIISTMRQTIATTVDNNSLTVKDRIDHIISIMEDSCRAITWPLRAPIIMFFAELADDERVETRQVGTSFQSFGDRYDIDWWHYAKIETSPAGTAITVDTDSIMACSMSPGEGKKTGGPKISIANLKAMVAASSVGASLKNPPNHTPVNPAELKEQ